MEPDNFWDAAFGGKNNLRLSFDAHTFRIRRDKSSVMYSFVYDTNKEVRVARMPKSPHQYMVYMLVDGKFDDVWVASSIDDVSMMVEKATGYTLNPFNQ